MATVSASLGGSWPDDAWPDDDTGAPTPLEPSLADCMAEVQRDVIAARSEVYAAIDAELNAIETDIKLAKGDANAALAIAVGSIDAELNAAFAPVVKAIDRQSSDLMRQLTEASYELRAAGIPVPYQPAQMALDLADPTGEALLNRLDGIPFDAGAQESINAPTLSAWPEPAAPMLSPPPPSAGALDPTEPDGSGESDCHCDCPAPVVNVTCPPAATPGGGGGAGGGGSGADEPAPPVSPGATPEPELTNPTLTFSPPPPPDLTLPTLIDTLPDGAPVYAPSPPAAPPVSPAPRPAGEYEYTGVRFDRAEVCEDIRVAKEFLKKTRLARDSGATPGSTPDALSSLYRFGVSYGKSLIDFTLSGFDSKVAEESFNQQIARTGDILGGLSQARAFLNYLPPETIPDKELSWTLAFAVGTAQKIESDTGMPMTLFSRPLTYLLNTAHATIIPDPAQLDAMRFAGLISKSRWYCLQEAHGNDADMRDIYYRSLEPRPTPDTIERMRLRDIIDEKTRDHYYTLSGMGASKLPDQFAKLALYVPTAPDIVSFGVRDVFDEQAVSAGGFDTDFDVKFPGFDDPDNANALVKWAKANGLTKETLRLFWRAHWKFPSDTQLFTMLHRLRADRPEYLGFVKAYAAWVDGGKVGQEPVEPPVISAREVQQAIEINDVAPAFVARLMAVSYLPMNRTDAINAFMAGTRDEGWLYERFRDNGYDEPTAREMVSIQVMLRARRLTNVSGVWTIRKILNAYRAGNITSARADQLLTPLVSDARQRQDMITGTDAEREAATRAQQIKSIRRGFLVGETDEGGAKLFLTRLGVDLRQLTELVDQWSAERNGRFKEVTVRNLISWQQLGIISHPDAFARYLRLGYTEADANRFTLQGMVARTDKLVAGFEKAEAKREKVIKNLKQAAKEEQSALEKRKKELEKIRADAEEELARIQKETDLRKPPAA